MKEMIEKSNPLPKYYQLENIILQEILAKKSVPGVKVATEFELRDRYKVSLNTVKKALSNLVDKGILIRERGRGTFLSKVPGKTVLVKPTKNIGIIFYEDIAFLLSDPFYSSIVMDIVRKCKDVEYDIMLSSMRNGDAMPSLITEKKVDAVILVGAFEDSFINILSKSTPTIVVDYFSKDVSADMVIIDNINGAEQAVKYLISLGHKDIAYIGGLDHKGVEWANSKERYQGYKRALAEAGIPVKKEYLHRVKADSRQRGYDAMKGLLRLENPPTAVFTFNDQFAVEAMKAAKEEGLKVPGDVSFIGFGEGLIEIPSALPSLTTVRIEKEKTGAIVMERLLANINGDDMGKYKTFTIPVQLILSNSCSLNRNI